jgi:hypothetical protein
VPPRSSSSLHHASSPSLVPPAVRHAHCRREHEGRSLVSGDTYGHSCASRSTLSSSAYQILHAHPVAQYARSSGFTLTPLSFCSGVRVFGAYLCFPSPLIRGENSDRVGLLRYSSRIYSRLRMGSSCFGGATSSQIWSLVRRVRSMNSNKLSPFLGCSRERDTDVNLLAPMVSHGIKNNTAASVRAGFLISCNSIRAAVIHILRDRMLAFPNYTAVVSTSHRYVRYKFAVLVLSFPLARPPCDNACPGR